ncbi:MAG: ThuA domain-containing protein, partial [Verrucomicrobiota bacterium]
MAAAEAKPALAPSSSSALQLQTRARIEKVKGSGQFELVEKAVAWDPKKTAIIICDMWNQHWCKGATERVAEMAPRMNAVIKEARRRGVLIIHAPSDTMKYYADFPQRKRAQQAPKAPAPPDLGKWRALNLAKEGPLPIDDSDGGCDDEPPCPGGGPWRHQIAVLEIFPEDYISDSGEEVYNLLQQSGIDNVIIMGVHTNMCVLGRPFSIRQMVSLGKNVLLMRDMTDTMYNSRRKPFVSHFAGTDLVVAHIEKFWCPTITSADFLGGEPFQFSKDRRKTIAFVIGENEYQTAETLPAFAREELAWRGFQLAFIHAPSEGGNEFKNFEKIKEADLVVVSVRRRTPPQAHLQLLRQHVAFGKPVAGIRTASHAWDAPPPDAQHAAWPAFDVEVFGAKYEGHYGNKPPGPASRIRQIGAASAHPILNGVPSEWISTAHLYRNRNLAPTVTALLEGQVEGRSEIEPVAFINSAQNRRAFYTSLGNPDDFKDPGFRRLLLNGILWALDERIPPAAKDYANSWQLMPVPGTWDEHAQGQLGSYNGVAWYRCTLNLPGDWSADLKLFVEKIDNAHETYFNGV